MPRRCLVLVLVAFTLAAQSTAPAGKPGSVAGRVVDAQTGDGLSGATVRLFPRGVAGRFQPPTTSSLADGSFHFDSVNTGIYTLYAQSRGFTSAGSAPAIVTVGDGSVVAGLSVKLNPLGSISGHVLNNAGRPVAAAEVELFRSYNLRGRLQTTRVGDIQSAKDGSYVFRRVTPGRYYIAAAPEDSARTFYANGVRLDDAAPIELAPGSSSSGADITLQPIPTFHVRGKVESFTPGALGKTTRLLLAPRDSPAFTALSETTETEPDGSFVIAHVPNGSYTLWLVGSYEGVESNSRRNRRRALARQDVDVNGSDVNGVSLPLMPPVNVTGRVVLGDAPAAASFSQIRVNLQPAAQLGFGSYASVALSSDGSFSFSDLDPGDYAVRVINVPTGMYVEEVALNRQNVLESGLDLSQGGGGDLNIVIRNGAGEVDGAIESDHGDVPSNCVALLVPETPAADGSGVLTGLLKPGGVFAISNVRPGRYFAFAVQEWDSVWQNADFERAVQREGTALEVSRNGHIQLQLRMMSPEQVETAAERLGLSLQ